MSCHLDWLQKPVVDKVTRAKWPKRIHFFGALPVGTLMRKVENRGLKLGLNKARGETVARIKDFLERRAKGQAPESSFGVKPEKDVSQLWTFAETSLFISYGIQCPTLTYVPFIPRPNFVYAYLTLSDQASEGRTAKPASRENRLVIGALEGMTTITSSERDSHQARQSSSKDSHNQLPPSPLATD